MLENILNNNRQWARAITEQDPQFFKRLSAQQNPKYMWIGCSDSRDPANQITGLDPGEVFVHRNVANIFVHTDLNALSVLQFAVDVLKVEHIIICGHYGCGGVRASYTDQRVGLADLWIKHVGDVSRKHNNVLTLAASQTEACDLLCELNVVEQANHICRTTIVRDAWDRGQKLSVHGWIYGLKDGLIRELQKGVDSRDSLESRYKQALTDIQSRSVS